VFGVELPAKDKVDESVEAESLSTQEKTRPKKILEIPLDDDGYMVDQVQAEFIVRCLERAEKEGFDEIILSIDTFGGVVFSAREIAEKLLQTTIPTTAYVKTKAISAGTFIAYACDTIVMNRLTTMGDAQMIIPQADGGIEEAPEKYVTVYRSDWEKSCEENKRSFDLARGYFEIDVEVLLIEVEGKKEYITRTNYEHRYGKLEENAQPKIEEIICPKGQLLTLTSSKAQRLGIATEYESYNDFLKQNYDISAAQVTKFEMTMNDNILRFLGTNSWIFVILTLVGLNGIYMEIKAPGIGISGFMALVCFVLVFGSRFLLGTASTFELMIFVVGIFLCLFEIFATPGVGVVGLSGIACMFLALVLASLPPFEGTLPSYEFHWNWIKTLSLQVGIAFVVSLVLFLIFLPTFFKSPLMQKRLGQMEFAVEKGYVVDTTSGQGYEGQEGVALGDLRPSGKVELSDGRKVDVVSDSGYVDEGTPVKVSVIDGNVIHVRRINNHA